MTFHINQDYIYTTARLMLLNSAYYGGVWLVLPPEIMAVCLVLLTSAYDGGVVVADVDMLHCQPNDVPCRKHYTELHRIQMS